MIQRTNFIKQFENILFGQSISFTQDKNDQELAKIIIETGQILQNDEMVAKGLQIIGIDTQKSDITIEKAFEIMKISKFTSPRIVEYACDTISSNFYSIIEEKEKFMSLLKELRKSEIEMIFQSKKLLIKNEDSLFDFINEMGSKYLFLYDYVEIQFLSVEKIERLIECVSNYEVSLHPLLWSSICRRLMIDVSGINKNCDKNRYINKNCDKNCKRKEAVICENGIFKYLESSSNSENVYLSKIIDVEVPKVGWGSIKNLFDHSKNTYVYVGSYNELQKNSYITIDFKDKQVNISKYYFSVTSSSGIVRNRPKSWEIQGSNDNSKWDKIDEKSNDSSFNNSGASNTFSVQNNNKYYRYIKIKEIQGTDRGHEIMLSEIEFYGSLISD